MKKLLITVIILLTVLILLVLSLGAAVFAHFNWQMFGFSFCADASTEKFSYNIEREADVFHITVHYLKASTSFNQRISQAHVQKIEGDTLKIGVHIDTSVFFNKGDLLYTTDIYVNSNVTKIVQVGKSGEFLIYDEEQGGLLREPEKIK